MLQVAPTAVPVLTLLNTVFQSIAEVFLLCLAGYILASTGVTDKATQRKLNVINVSLFTPALLFSKVAFSLTPAKLKEMWIIPLGFVLITGVSAAVAWSLAKLFRLKRSQTNFAICAAMFQNSNSLPIALVQSIVSVVPGLKWGKDDSKDQMLGRALTYMVLYSTLGMVLRWSYGVQLLAAADDPEPEAPTPQNGVPTPMNGIPTPQGVPARILSADAPGHILSPEPIARDDPFDHPEGLAALAVENRMAERGRSGHLSSDINPHSLPSHRSPFSLSPRGSNGSPAPGKQRRHSTMSRRSSGSRPPISRAESGREFLGLPEQPRRPLVDLVEDSSESEAEDADEWGSGSLPNLRRRTSPLRTPTQQFFHRIKVGARIFWDKLNSFMTVPTWAALVSIIIALIPPLQAQVSQIRPFVGAIKSAGQCSIPVTLVVLGAFFYTPPQPISLPADEQATGIKGFIERQRKAWNTPKPKQYEGENRAVFVAVMSRMVLVPLLFLPFIALLAEYDWFSAAEDPVFILCAVLLVSSPPALTLAQLTQAASGDAFERLISKTISWSYAVLTPPLTLVYVVVGLVFSRL